jgi:hypothetical protein
MNILLLLDKKINKTLLGQVQLQVENLYKKQAGIEIKWFTQEKDYTNYPKAEYRPGFEGIEQSWLTEQCKEIYKKWQEEVDCVVFLIHSDNWTLNGVWGWNMSATFSGYGVQQCRFAQVAGHSDIRNVNNSAGTLYHELHHDHDTFIYNYTGQMVENYLDVRNWDFQVTHGESPLWNYIRTTNDNLESISKIGPLLNTALEKRRAIFDKKISTMKKIISLLEKVIVLQRELISRQRGNIAVLPDNKCL